MPAIFSKDKVLVALSGGVDSSVCVRLLQNKGYDVSAVVLDMSPAHAPTVAAAKEAAASLGVPLYVKNMHEEFQKNVIDYFTDSYKRGITPNPCVVCNPKVKFKALIDTADELEIKYIATGHYASIINDGGIYKIKPSLCAARDQSYMLYRLGQDVLSRLVLPLSDLDKPRVREIAEQLGLSCANAPDSQENCFIPDNDYACYIEEHCGASPRGEFISPEGGICGEHRGIIHYTVGQRKRLGIALGRPVFIKRIDPETNRIYLADSGNEFADSVILSDVVTASGELINNEFNCFVKIRSVSKLAAAHIVPMPDSSADLSYADGSQQIKVVFDIPQRAPAKGQSVVMYDLLGCVIGGGFIDSEIE